MQKVLSNLLKIFIITLAFIFVGCPTPTDPISVIQFQIIYDGNGNISGSPPFDSNYYLKGDPITILYPTDMVKDGYIFTEWNTHADGSGVSYLPNKTYTITMDNPDINTDFVDIILYAQWKPMTFTITYNGNGYTGGIVPSDSNNYEEGTSVTIASAGNMVRDGYTFIGWNTASDRSGISYEVGSTYLMQNKNVTLYAQWNVPVSSVSSNWHCTIILKTDNSLWATGFQDAGEFGNGFSTYSINHPFLFFASRNSPLLQLFFPTT